MHRRELAILALSGLFLSLTPHVSQATTLATFADPTIGSPPPPFLFSVSQTSGTIAGSWTGTGLTLETINGTFTDVQFSMPAIPLDASFVTGPGVIEFRELDSTLILQITFSEAILDDPLSFGATELVGTGELSFSGPAVEPPGILDGTENFSFPFANQTGTAADYVATAAFTSSGELVPEPSTLAGLAILTLVSARRRRR